MGNKLANVFTIGFTGKSAMGFFDLLRRSGVTTLLDVRLHNTSQLAGYAKKDDLRFFLKEIADIEYAEVRELAPEKSLLKAYQSKSMSWEAYADRYMNGLATRNVERLVDRRMFVNGCLLCSEHLPHQCHRKLAIEYLNAHWPIAMTITHLY